MKNNVILRFSNHCSRNPFVWSQYRRFLMCKMYQSAVFYFSVSLSPRHCTFSVGIVLSSSICGGRSSRWAIITRCDLSALLFCIVIVQGRGDMQSREYALHLVRFAGCHFIQTCWVVTNHLKLFKRNNHKYKRIIVFFLQLEPSLGIP